MKQNLINSEKVTCRTRYNKIQSPGLVCRDPSLTEPDLNLSVRQLLANHSRGVNSPVKVYDPEYYQTEDNEGIEVPIINDLTEYQDIKERLEESISEAKARLEELAAAEGSPSPDDPTVEAPQA